MASNVVEIDRFLTPKELAERLRHERPAVDAWRRRGEGPPFIRLPNGRVLYRLSDVELWISGRTIGQVS